MCKKKFEYGDMNTISSFPLKKGWKGVSARLCTVVLGSYLAFVEGFDCSCGNYGKWGGMAGAYVLVKRVLGFGGFGFPFGGKKTVYMYFGQGLLLNSQREGFEEKEFSFFCAGGAYRVAVVCKK